MFLDILRYSKIIVSQLYQSKSTKSNKSGKSVKIEKSTQSVIHTKCVKSVKIVKNAKSPKVSKVVLLQVSIYWYVFAYLYVVVLYDPGAGHFLRFSLSPRHRATIVAPNHYYSTIWSMQIRANQGNSCTGRN